MRGIIFTTKPIWNPTTLTAENGVIPFPDLRLETNSFGDGTMMFNEKWFFLKEGVYEIDIEAIVYGAMNIQLGIGFGETMNNERLAFRGMVSKATTSPEEIRNVRLRTYFSVCGPGTKLFPCFCADNFEVILPSERVWNNYSIRGIIKKESDEYVPGFDIRRIDYETWAYKKPADQIIGNQNIVYQKKDPPIVNSIVPK